MNDRWDLLLFVAGMFLLPAAILRGADAQPDEELLRRRDEAIQLGDSGKTAEAVAAFTSLIKASEEKLGADHRFTLRQKMGLGKAYGLQGRLKESEVAYDHVLSDQTRVLGPDDVDTLRTRGGHAVALYQCGKREEGISEMREVLKAQTRTSGEGDEETEVTRESLVIMMTGTGQLGEAVAGLRAVWRACEQKYGAVHEKTLTAGCKLVDVLGDAGSREEALSLANALLPDLERVTGAESPASLDLRESIYGLQILLGHWKEGEAGLSKLIPILNRALGEQAITTLTAHYHLGCVLSYRERFTEASDELGIAVAGYEKQPGAWPTVPGSLRFSYAEALEKVGKYEAALEQYRGSADALAATAGADTERTLSARLSAVFMLFQLDRSKEAQDEARVVAATARIALGSGHVITLTARRFALWSVSSEKREAAYRELLADDERFLGADATETILARTNLGGMLSDANKLADAEKELRTAFALTDSHFGKDDPHTVRCCGKLGICLLRQHQWPEGIALLKRAEESENKQSPEGSAMQRYYADWVKWAESIIRTERLERRERVSLDKIFQ